MKAIEYYYYRNKEKVNGSTMFSNKQTGTFYFDPKKFEDTKDNHYNMVADSLDGWGEPSYGLTITKITETL